MILRTTWLPSITLLSTLVAAGCGPSSDDPIDGDFLGAGGKADDGSEIDRADACRVLKMVNTEPDDRLIDVVHLSEPAADGIAEFRAGEDGTLGTADDRWFTTLADLDAVPYVGPVTYHKLTTRALGDDVYQCGAVPVQVLGFNDFHGNLKPPSGATGRIQTGPAPTDVVDAGGVEYLATHLAMLRDGHANTVTVGAGDLIGGSPLMSAVFKNEPSIEAMNALGLDFTAVGNHEFDKGPAELRRMQAGGCEAGGCVAHAFKGASFQYLAANVVETATGKTLFPPYAVRSFGNTRVGFIGLTLAGTPKIVTPAGVAGLEFRGEIETINSAVRELQKHGVGGFVVLLHEGGAQAMGGGYNDCSMLTGALLPILTGLDPAVKVVVSAHTHQAYNCKIDGRIVTSAASYGRMISDIELTVDEVSGGITAATANNVIVTRDVPRDPAEAAILATYDPLYSAIANRVVGSITANLTNAPDEDGETALGDVLADAQLDATTAAGAQISFMNSGGVRAELTYGQISGGEQPGQVTYEEAFAVQPFANDLVTLSMTGTQIHALLEQQWSALPGGGIKQTTLFASAGFGYAIDAGAPIGSRVDPSTITLDGATISPAATYRVTVSAFLATGGDGFTTFSGGTGNTPGGVDVDALVGYLGGHPGLAPPATNRAYRR